MVTAIKQRLLNMLFNHFYDRLESSCIIRISSISSLCNFFKEPARITLNLKRFCIPRIPDEKITMVRKRLLRRIVFAEVIFDLIFKHFPTVLNNRCTEMITGNFRFWLVLYSVVVSNCSFPFIPSLSFTPNIIQPGDASFHPDSQAPCANIALKLMPVFASLAFAKGMKNLINSAGDNF